MRSRGRSFPARAEGIVVPTGEAPVDGVPSGELGKASRHGARLGVAVGAMTQLLSLVTTVILARLLVPRDFGLVAAANSAMVVLSTLTQAGFGSSLVRDTTSDIRRSSTLFWAAFLVGLVPGVILLAAARPVATAVGVGAAAPYLMALAPAPLLNTLVTVPRSLLQRDLRFSAVYTIDTVYVVVYTVVQITLAAAGAGAWSVVIGQLACVVVQLPVAMVLARFRPRFVLDRQVLRETRRFNSGLLASSTAGTLAKNVDYWTVGNLSGARVLGVYYVAYVLPNILRQRLTQVATDVLYPVFAKVQDDKTRLREFYLRSVSMHALLGFPAMAGIAALASPILSVFFGHRWLGAAAPLRLLALAALVEIATQAASTVFLAVGVPGRAAMMQVVRLATMGIGLTLVVVFSAGLQAVAGAVLAGTIAAAIYAQIRVCSPLDVRARVLLRSLLPVSLSTAAMAGAAALLAHVLAAAHFSPLLQLVCCIPASAVVLLGVGFGLFRREAREHARELWRLVRPAGRMPSKRRRLNA